MKVEDFEQVSNSLDQSNAVIESKLIRSSPDVPVSLFHAELKIGDVPFSCHVLNDGRRVLAQREVVGILTGHKKGNLGRYLLTPALRNYLDVEKISREAIDFVIPSFR